MNATHTYKYTIGRAATKFAIVAAKVAVQMLEFAQIADLVIPAGLKLASTSVVFALAAAHTRNTHAKLELVRLCRMSYWIWTITWISDIVRAIAEPGSRHLRAAIRALNRNLNENLNENLDDGVINDDDTI